MKVSISDKEADIEEIYEEMGKAIYDSFKAGEDVGKDYAKECKKIDILIFNKALLLTYFNTK